MLHINSNYIKSLSAITLLLVLTPTLITAGDEKNKKTFVEEVAQDTIRQTALGIAIPIGIQAGVTIGEKYLAEVFLTLSTLCICAGCYMFEQNYNICSIIAMVIPGMALGSMGMRELRDSIQKTTRKNYYSINCLT